MHQGYAATVKNSSHVQIGTPEETCPRQPQVQEQMERLSKLTEALESIAVELGRRLDPIISPIGPDSCVDKLLLPRMPLAPIADSLESIGSRIDSVYMMIRGFIKRIEI